MKDKTAPDKYYAQAQGCRIVDVDEMSERIEKACTVHAADVLAVLKALEDEMVGSLAKGEIVHLGNVGGFQLGLRSAGALKSEDFKALLIKKARVNFRPGKSLRKMLATLEYSRVDKREKKVTAPSGGGSTGGGGGETPFS